MMTSKEHQEVRESVLPVMAGPELKRCIHMQINNGVYRSGFATTQGAYERAQTDLYSALDTVEQRLSQHRFLVGDKYAAPFQFAVGFLVSL